jgi:hypothetical protein
MSLTGGGMVLMSALASAYVGGGELLMLALLSVVIGNEQELWGFCERRHRQLVLNSGGERHDRDDEGVMNPHLLMRWRWNIFWNYFFISYNTSE